MAILTFSGNGIGFITSFFSGSADSDGLNRFDADGDEGSSVAFRFVPTAPHMSVAESGPVAGGGPPRYGTLKTLTGTQFRRHTFVLHGDSVILRRK